MTDKKKKDLPILLIWEELPEKISFFLIPASDISKVEMRMLRASHNNLMNSIKIDESFAKESEINRSLFHLHYMLCDPMGSWIDEDSKETSARDLNISREEFENLLGKWHKYILCTDEKPITIPKSKMIQSGWLL